jgi:hypothetical protein
MVWILAIAVGLFLVVSLVPIIVGAVTHWRLERELRRLGLIGKAPEPR